MSGSLPVAKPLLIFRFLTVASVYFQTLNTRVALLPLIVKFSAPAPSIVMSLVMASSPLVRVIVLLARLESN